MLAQSFPQKPLVVAVRRAIIGAGLAMMGAAAPSLSAAESDNNTTLSISGYIKGDFIIDEGADLGDSFAVSAIPAEGSDGDVRNGHVRLHARQSRVRIKTDTEMSNGESLETHIEGDFFGTGGNENFSNSTGLRLRHAYVTVGRWTIGQTWTNFTDLVAYPSTLDFFGPMGKSFARQGQIRYTLPNGLAFSIENPETDGDGALGRLRESTGGVGEDLSPDLVTAWRGGSGGILGNYEFAAVYRLLGVNGVLDGARIDETENGWGVNLAGAWEAGSNTLSASVTFGDGIGRYIINGGGNGLFVDDSGNVETVESMGASLEFTRKWTNEINSTLAYGYFENDEPSRSNGVDNLTSVHLNTLWTPIPEATFGIEYAYGDAEYTDGNGDASRLQFSAQRNF